MVIILLLFTVLGLYCLIYELTRYIKEKGIAKQGLVVHGTIVSNKAFRSDTGTMYKPTIRFNATTGESITFAYKYYSADFNYVEGESIEVVYNPNKPKDARIYSDGVKLSSYITGMVFGAVFAVVGIGGIILMGGFIVLEASVVAKLGLGVFLVIGLGMLTTGFVMIHKIRTRNNNGIKVNGKVIANDSHMTTMSNNHRVRSYKPTIEFTTTQGEKVVVAYPYSSNTLKFKVGESVEIMYNRDNPNDASINNFNGTWFAPLIVMIIGVAFTGSATFALIMTLMFN